MIIEVRDFGIPGYETCKVIWNQHPQLMDAIFTGGSWTGLSKVCISPRRTYLMGERGISIAIKGLSLFKAPSFKLSDIPAKGAVAKTLKTAYRYCVDHNNWFRETPQQYESRIRCEEVLYDDKGIVLHLAMYPDKHTAKTHYEGESMRQKSRLIMNAAYTEKKSQPVTEPEWDDDGLDEQISYHQEDEDIPF